MKKLFLKGIPKLQFNSPDVPSLSSDRRSKRNRRSQCTLISSFSKHSPSPSFKVSQEEKTKQRLDEHQRKRELIVRNIRKRMSEVSHPVYDEQAVSFELNFNFQTPMSRKDNILHPQLPGPIKRKAPQNPVHFGSDHPTERYPDHR